VQSGQCNDVIARKFKEREDLSLTRLFSAVFGFGNEIAPPASGLPNHNNLGINGLAPKTAFVI